MSKSYMKLYFEDGTEFNEVIKMLLDKISKLELRLTTLESEIQIMNIPKDK